MTPIVVVAYNRANSLKRILRFISQGFYPEGNIPLIISIDKGNNDDVIKIANDFEWAHGDKQVICHDVNLGLRAHIIECASRSREYGSVIILEDDLLVSPNFYNYVQAALAYSEDKEYIGGISLYNHQYNVHTSDPFWPVEDGYDNWYFQFASSWGEAWSYKQWQRFYDWYVVNKDKPLESDNFPPYVAAWSSKSWLKYFIKYLIESDEYFLYPRISLTSNCSDKGEHAIGGDNTAFQIPLLYANKKAYEFSSLQSSKAVYDAFYENRRVAEKLGHGSVTVDLYGYKPVCKTRYLLTGKLLNYKIVDSFSCSMRPHEMNVLERLPGNDLFLYDTEHIEKNPVNSKAHDKRRLRYKFKIVKREQAISIMKNQMCEDIKKLRRKKLK